MRPSIEIHVRVSALAGSSSVRDNIRENRDGAFSRGDAIPLSFQCCPSPDDAIAARRINAMKRVSAPRVCRRMWVVAATTVRDVTAALTKSACADVKSRACTLTFHVCVLVWPRFHPAAWARNLGKSLRAAGDTCI